MTDPAPIAIPEELAAQLEQLGGQLVWRIGRADGGGVVVRLGLASSTPRFAERPRLRSLGDDELREALESGGYTVEWVEP